MCIYEVFTLSIAKIQVDANAKILLAPPKIVHIKVFTATISENDNDTESESGTSRRAAYITPV